MMKINFYTEQFLGDSKKSVVELDGERFKAQETFKKPVFFRSITDACHYLIGKGYTPDITLEEACKLNLI